MKFFKIGFVVFLLLFSCKKNEKFVSCPEYEKIIGKWKSINGDDKFEIEFTKKGKYIRKSDFDRFEKLQILNCKYENEKLQLEIKNTIYNYRLDLSSNLDTLKTGMSAFNLPEKSLDYYIYFIKTK